MMLREILFEQTEESKRQAVKKHLGQQVIIDDNRNGWYSGYLLREESNNQTYQIKIAIEQKPKILYYKNLEKLMIVINNSRRKISEFD
jgi:hypothetical protein